MMPWIEARLQTDGQPSAFRSNHYSLYSLTLLLQEIEQDAGNSNRLVLVEGPRSTVLYSSAKGMYLFREGKGKPFASFEADGLTHAVRLRYHDPLNVKSGVRPSGETLHGWDGTIALLASAVRHSQYWKDLQTIEIDEQFDHFADETISTYEIWATPKQDFTVMWPNTLPRYAGAYSFSRNRPVLLATTTVHRSESYGMTGSVGSMELYPELVQAMYEESWWTSWNLAYASFVNREHLLAPPVFIDMSHQRMMHCPPHSMDFTIQWR